MIRSFFLIISLILHIAFLYLFSSLTLSHGKRYENETQPEKKEETITIRPIIYLLPNPGKKSNFSHKLDKTKSLAKKEDFHQDEQQKNIEAQKENKTKPSSPPGPSNDGLEKSEPMPGFDQPPLREEAPNSSPAAPPKITGSNYSFALKPHEVRSIIYRHHRRTGTTSGSNPGDNNQYPNQVLLTTSSNRGCNIQPWARRAVNRVKNNWLIPAAVLVGASGQVTITVIVEKDGKISNIRLSKSSQLAALDQAAITAFALSNPLPPLPGDFPYRNLSTDFVFDYQTPATPTDIDINTNKEGEREIGRGN